MVADGTRSGEVGRVVFAGRFGFFESRLYTSGTVITFLVTILAQEKKGGGSITGLLIILIPMGAILYMTIMPQRKQRQKQAALLSKLETGDEVITTGGIIGTITFVEDDLYHVEIDTDVVIRIAKSGVARSLSEPAEPTKGSSKSKGASRGRKGLLAGALGGSSTKAEEAGEQQTPDTDIETATGTDSEPSDSESAQGNANVSDSEPSEAASQGSTGQINKK